MNKPIPDNASRRKFIKNTAAGSAFWMMQPYIFHEKAGKKDNIKIPGSIHNLPDLYKSIDLSPASWVWYPGTRTLPNTVVLFRKKFEVRKKVVSAKGWAIGESRYHIYVNEKWLHFGPAPCDPRFTEADPLDFSTILNPGTNVIGMKVLFYGFGDGTWPIGKPGMIFRLDFVYEDGSSEQVVSDNSWDCMIARSWRPGQYKRWYLRAFQEEFDANLYPEEWLSVNYQPDNQWNKAMILNCKSSKPALCSDYNEYMYEINTREEDCDLRERFIPSIAGIEVPASGLAEKKKLKWNRAAEEYFEMVTPDAYELSGDLQVVESPENQWTFNLDPGISALLTFEFHEQIVGFPYFTIIAPKGTVVELMVQEGHRVNSVHPLMNNHFHSWTRLICREGKNVFRTFDYESLRWLQLHIRNASGNITVSGVAVARRLYPWPHQPEIKCSEPELMNVFNASINTLYNSAQETIVDGMGRERQQYSGDCGHQLHGIFYAFGESRLPARYINTYSQGMVHEGYFLDSWPAYDRLARIMERQLNLTSWGPILDHSVGFNFDCFYYYLYTGDLIALKEIFPRLIRFKNYLKKILDHDTHLLPVENLGIPSVWIDHDAYHKQRDKQCAFNLYAAAMLENAFLRLCKVFSDEHNGTEAKELADEIKQGVINNFWSDKDQLLIINKPWLAEDGEIRLCDRSLATAVMYDQIPASGIGQALKILAETPPEMGLSYPANAGWRYWALAKGGKTDVVINELSQKWASLDSVKLNNTLQESWTVQPDSGSQWSHCPVVPLYMLYMGIIGIQPVKPGFEEVCFWPQLDRIQDLEVNIRTVKGTVYFHSEGLKGYRKIEIQMPAGMEGSIKLDTREKINLEPAGITPDKYQVFKLKKEARNIIILKFT